ncbi:MAG: hypothetical protein KC733_05085 [Candidatus Omnitrophica bacterium]|nr:hypothetical protein [Candidatus Omnitrophota bacterium]
MRIIINFFRQDFQWLITKQDEFPLLDQNGLKKFFRNSYDPVLGWVRKPNTKGVEKSAKRKTFYSIDSLGSRSNLAGKNKKKSIATFGDSYVFCRQVNDEETWQYFLSIKLNIDVMNFGVGNYGVDQALLRYQNSSLPKEVKVVILGFVPETICRIHSYWKHYLEFGNTFAFKPRFILQDNDLKYIPNAMQSSEDFTKIKEKLSFIQQNDYFYKFKFRNIQFRFPYILSFLRNASRNFELLSSLTYRFWARLLRQSTIKIENEPFHLIMQANIKQAHQMYKQERATKLFEAILYRFKEIAKEKGHQPIILVMPQLIDLKMGLMNKMSYQGFFQSLNNKVPVIDLTDFILKYDFEQLYAEDLYGGHFSKEGNTLVAEYISEKINEIYPEYLSSTIKKCKI